MARFPRRIAVVGAAVGAVAMVGIAGCGGGQPKASGTSVAGRSATTVAPTTLTSAASTTSANGASGSSGSSGSTGPSGSDFQGAKDEFVGENLVDGGVDQSIPYELAIIDLRNGESSGGGDTSGYSSAISALTDLEGSNSGGGPNTVNSQADTDTAQLNTFFNIVATNTSGDYCYATGSNTIAAGSEWAIEPDGIESGVIDAPLKQAVGDLQQALSATDVGTSCYPAAIDDLQNLETASKSDIASSTSTSTSTISSSGAGANAGASTGNQIGLEIAYLNNFFNVLGQTTSPVLTNSTSGGGAGSSVGAG